MSRSAASRGVRARVVGVPHRRGPMPGKCRLELANPFLSDVARTWS